MGEERVPPVDSPWYYNDGATSTKPVTGSAAIFATFLLYMKIHRDRDKTSAGVYGLVLHMKQIKP